MAVDPSLINAIVPAAFFGTIGWVTTTWLRVRHGYPLQNSWGKPMLPASVSETVERIKLSAQENAQLRAELASVKDRMEVLERIAVDPGRRLASEIDALSTKGLN